MNKKQDGEQQFNLQFPAEAEVKLSSTSPVEKSHSAQHVVELLQELRTHPIELEMPNEKLPSEYAALEASRDSYLQFYNFAPIGYLTLTEDGLIAEANLTCSTQLGLERDKLINCRFAKYVKPEEGDRWYRHCLHAKQHLEIQNCELTLRRADDTFFQARLASLYTEAPDSPPVMHIAFTDMTESKQAEEALRETEIRHAQTLARAGLDTWLWDIKTDYLDFSARWAEMRVYRLEEIKPDISVWKNGIHPDHLPVMRAKLAEHFAGCSPFFQAEYRVPNKSGSWKWILDRGMVTERDAEGNPLSMVGTEMDFTEHKQAKEALNIAAIAFEAQNGIIVTNARYVILRLNRAFSHITGYNAKEVIGLTPSFLRSGLHDEDFYQTIWLSVARKSYWHGEIWDKRKNGEIFPLWLTLTAVTDAEGEVTHFVGSFTDITVQKQAEKILLEAHQNLENQVANTNEELEKSKEEATEINAALKVLLKYRETDKSEAQIALLCEMEVTIMPFLKKLKGASTGRRQTTRLISILEINLQHLMESYGKTTTLSAAFHQLTPVEIQVASLLKQGLSTKLIASTLNIASGTVSIHRKHIRKKLGLEGKAANLHSYLNSLTE
jgi:PAS domain S-box-containing protein